MAHGAFVTKGGGTKKRPETHLLLDGGKLAIDPTLEDEFYRIYTRACFVENEWLYVVEMKTDPYFALMAEIDFKAENGLLDEEILSIVKSMQTAILGVTGDVPELDRRCVVLTAPQEKDKDGKYMKSGIHIIWRGIPTDLETANLLRTAMRL